MHYTVYKMLPMQTRNVYQLLVQDGSLCFRFILLRGPKWEYIYRGAFLLFEM